MNSEVVDTMAVCKVQKLTLDQSYMSYVTKIDM